MLTLIRSSFCVRASAQHSKLGCIFVTLLQNRGFATVADYVALPKPSAEQELVIKAIKQGRNARVIAVAGSGKTTTILQIAKAFPERRILGITMAYVLIIALLYNRRLKEDMRHRQAQLALNGNLQVDNYHGLGYYLYDAQDCATDQGLKRIVLEDTKPVEKLDFDLFCLDELQDATPIIYAFIRKLIRDNQSTKSLQYVVLGDPRQVTDLCHPC